MVGDEEFGVASHEASGGAKAYGRSDTSSFAEQNIGDENFWLSTDQQRKKTAV